MPVETRGRNLYFNNLKNDSTISIFDLRKRNWTMAAARNDDTVSTASTSSRVSHFGLNQCPRSNRLRAMRNDITAEMEGCRRLFDAVAMCTEGTNDFDDAACESDGARHGLRDMVYDFISYARQMALDQPNKVISLSRTRIKLGAKNISQPREKPP